MDNNSYVSEMNIARESEFFKYNITYPVLKLYKKCVYHDKYEQEIIDNINYRIYKDIMDFKNNIRSESIKYKKMYEEQFFKEGDKPFKYQYEVFVTYEIPYDKDNIISILITKYQFTGGAHGMTYLTAYNYDLLTGEELKLQDMFKNGVDYEKIVNEYIHREINKNPEEYFQGDDGFKGISKNQPFYIDEDGIVIYFGLYEIAPYYVGIPKFKLKFDEFEDILVLN